jgi:hypothetical protein
MSLERYRAIGEHLMMIEEEWGALPGVASRPRVGCLESSA